jgi:hypothetical protein
MFTIKTLPAAHLTIKSKSTSSRYLAKALLKTVVKQLTGIKYVLAKDLPAQLGEGAYSHVFAHPTDDSKVIKICWRSPNYIQYLEWCWGHQDNPYVPRIDSMTLVRNKLGGCLSELAIVVLERLAPCDSYEPEHEGNARVYDDFKDAFHMAAREPETVDPLLVEVRKWLDGFVRADGAWYDLHNGNIMVRGKSQAVLTDPVGG